MSRKVTAHLFSSVNGVVESPNLWQFDAFGPEEGQLMGEVIGPVTDVVIGRLLWEEWSAFWPEAEDPFAQFINPVRKHVVTSTLSGDLPWNSTAIDGDPVDYVRHLREQEGGDISVTGGIDTVRSLFLAGAIDELIPHHAPGGDEPRAPTVRRQRADHSALARARPADQRRQCRPDLQPPTGRLTRPRIGRHPGHGGAGVGRSSLAGGRGG